MPFDKSTSTYWCHDCGREMHIDYAKSGDTTLVLGCRSGCEYTCQFIAMRLKTEQNTKTITTTSEKPQGK